MGKIFRKHGTTVDSYLTLDEKQESVARCRCGWKSRPYTTLDAAIDHGLRHEREMRLKERERAVMS